MLKGSPAQTSSRTIPQSVRFRSHRAWDYLWQDASLARLSWQSDNFQGGCVCKNDSLADAQKNRSRRKQRSLRALKHSEHGTVDCMNG